MKKSKLQLDSIIVISLLVFSVIPYLNLGKLSIFFSNNFIYFYLLGSVLLFFLLVVNNKMLIQKKDLLMLFVSLVFCTFGYIHNNVAMGNVMTMICSILYLYYFRKCELENKKVLLLICTVASLLFVYISTTVVNSFYSHNSSLNPNAVAQILFVLLIILNHLLNFFNKRKIIILIFSILILIGIYNCESRSVLFVSILYLIISSISKKMMKKEKYLKKEKIIYWIIIIAGLLVPYILVNMYTNSYTLTFSLFGKSLYSGREKIWIVVLDELKNIKYFLFGIPTNQYYSLMFTSNLHNVFLTVLANYGIIYFLIYFNYLFKNFENIIKNKTNNIYLSFGIIFILLVGSMENILFSTEINFLFCLLFSLSIKFQNEKEGSLDESIKKELSL